MAEIHAKKPFSNRTEIKAFKNSKNQRLFVSKTSSLFNDFHAFIAYVPVLD